MEFDNANTSTDQGNIGEARAIYELTKLGYEVLSPLTNNRKYDLVVTRDSITFERVQVKTSSSKFKTDNAGWNFDLTTSGGNQSFTTIRKRESGDYDLLFALSADGRCWLIPVSKMTTNERSITLGGTSFLSKYHEFELNVDEPFKPNKTSSKIWDYPSKVVYNTFIANNSNAAQTLRDLEVIVNKENRQHLKDIVEPFMEEIDSTDISKLSCKHFTAIELQELVNQYPLTKIGEMYGISDNAVKRWVDKWNIERPPRGHFLRK